MKEPNGTIYLNKDPGRLWDSGGNVIDAGELNEPLRDTLIEEMVHMWFDTDIGHAPSNTQEQQDAMAAMRVACGHHNF